ncbi:MAG: hypothetical protein AAGJ35_11735, partial [Myxococcota bacterium]
MGFRTFLGALCVWALGCMYGATSEAQNQYLDPCSAANPCNVLARLVCVTTNRRSFCTYSCNNKDQFCPKQPCRFSGALGGVCACQSDQDCQPPGQSSKLRCVNGLCAGTKGVDEPCDDSDNLCAAGLICARVGGATQATCLALCAVPVQGAAERCANGDPCILVPSTPNNPVPRNYGACFCRQDNDCEQGSTCVRNHCRKPGFFGDFCNAQRPCQRGLVCIDSTSSQDGVCLQSCSVVASCSGGEACVSADRQSVCRCNAQNPCPSPDLRCVKGSCIGTARCSQDTPCPGGTVCVRESATDRFGICRPACRG